MKRSSIRLALLSVLLLATSAWGVPAPHGSPVDLPSRPSPAIYQVKKGDSLYAISRRTGVPVKDLQRLNGLTGDKIKPAQILLLAPKVASGKETAGQEKKAAADAPARRTATAAPANATYKVRKGDSLYSIARRHGLTVHELKHINGLRNDTLKPGQKLLLAAEANLAPPAALSACPDPAKLLREESPDKLPEEGLDSLAEVAYSYLSTPYRFGGDSRKGIDCSSFVRTVFHELNIDLPRTAREQYRLGEEVAPAELQSGDLLFFRTYAKYPSHVGIYLGDHKMIHASPRSRRVVITNVDAPYFRSRFIGARRLALLGDSLNLEDLTRDVEEEPEPQGDEGLDPTANGGDN